MDECQVRSLQISVLFSCLGSHSLSGSAARLLIIVPNELPDEMYTVSPASTPARRIDDRGQCSDVTSLIFQLRRMVHSTMQVSGTFAAVFSNLQRRTTTHPPSHPSRRKVQSRNDAPPFLSFWLHAIGDGEPDLHNRAAAPLTLVALLPQIRPMTHFHFAASTSSTEDILSDIFTTRTALLCRIVNSPCHSLAA
jgi:hypothetical protein